MNKERKSIAVLPDLWKRFQEICKQNDESASRRIGLLIKEWIKQHEARTNK